MNCRETSKANRSVEGLTTICGLTLYDPGVISQHRPDNAHPLEI